MAFIGIRIPSDVSRLLSSIEIPGDKCDTASMHITLLCLEDNCPIDVIAKTLEATYNVVHDFKPFLVKTNKVEYFSVEENNPYPLIAKIESEELHNLNKKLKKVLDDNNIKYSKKFKDYKPHITLSFSEEKPEEFEIDEVDFYVHELVLWGGQHGDDRVFVTFPLKCPEKKNAKLLNRIDNFCKIAC